MIPLARNAQMHRMVIALGGHAILRRGEDGTIEQQLEHADECMHSIARIAKKGHPIILTHGNGPIVGNIVIQNQAVRDRIPPMPLFICDADSEGGIGFMLQMTLYNQLRRNGVTRPIVTVITQVAVDPKDEAFQRPSKPIGPHYSSEEAKRLRREESWMFREETMGWRRLVPSPRPLRIIEAPVIKRLIDQGDLVIAAGGGGIPVKQHSDGTLMGVDAVIDKDWASALLACEVSANLLVILMDEDMIYLSYDLPERRGLRQATVLEMDRHLREGQFAPGSMRPKVEAAVHFLKTCGEEVIICRAECLMSALAGKSGTRITTDASKR